MWRGLLLSRAVQQFVEDVAWGDLDHLLVDLPPGTGDVQMALARLLPRTELVLVTTPQLAVEKVAARAGDMGRRGNLRIAGVIENMSGFTCEHGTTYDLFGRGGGERLASALGVDLLGQLPLDPALAAGGDAGMPVAHGDGPTAAAFEDLAGRLDEPAASSADMAGCSARLLRTLDAAVAAADPGEG
jgi:ATP-binding protein involved in chromosome partitioning